MRRYGKLRAALLPYLEVAVVTSALTGLLFAILLYICTPSTTGEQYRDFLLILAFWLALFGILLTWKKGIQLLNYPRFFFFVASCIASSVVVYGAVRVLPSYLEIIFKFPGRHISMHLLICLLGLAITGMLCGWHWSVRLLLHLGWLASVFFNYYFVLV